MTPVQPAAVAMVARGRHGRGRSLDYLELAGRELLPAYYLLSLSNYLSVSLLITGMYT